MLEQQKKNKPLVSVIVPCYNMEQYVKRAVDSLVANDYENKQIILVNDGSTDGTLEILRSYEKSYSYIKVVDKVNGGVSSARNFGLDVAEGEYVMFADPDDEVWPKFVETAVDAITADEGYDIVMFGFQDGDGNRFSPRPFAAKNKHEVLNDFFPLFFSYTRADIETWLEGQRLRGKPGGQIWKFMFRNSIISDFHLRFAPHLKAGEDQMFISMFLLFANSFKSIPDIVYTYYIRPNGLYMSNITAINPVRTLQNKISLLEERMRIASVYKEKTSCEDARFLYTGSIVLSCFQLAVLYSQKISYYRYYSVYVNLPEVCQCIEDFDFHKGGAVKKWIPMFLLKQRLNRCLYAMIWLATKCKIRFSI